jgi:two-component system, chemotaxis family, response regulator Rcp1
LPGSRSILIIEDNPADIRLIHEALRDLRPPVDLYSVLDGDEALLYLRREGKFAQAVRPRLIFLDFNLPKSDSRAILSSIKEDENLSIIPVAILTSSSSEQDARHAYRLHASCYLTKPVDLDSFIDKIRATVHFWLDVAYVPA